MRVGVAVREIPVPPGTALGGYARRTALARGMARPLTVRAVTIASDGGDAVVLLVYDLLTVTRDLSMLVRAILAPEVDPAHVLTAATHTHCAPRDLTMESHAALVTSLAELGADAAREALDHAVAVRLVAGTTASLGVGRNRRVATLPVDDHATVVLAERLHADNHPTGEVVATLVNFACHPTTLGPDMTDAHPDYPGHLRATVEAGLGGVCVFLQGFAGSTNPVVAAGTADADRVGLAVAGPVLTLAAQLRAVGRRATFVSLSEGRNLPARIADGCEHSGPVCAARRMVSVTPVRSRSLTVRWPSRPRSPPNAGSPICNTRVIR